MDRAMEEKLIECVSAHECLFNNRSENYKNAQLKQDIWDQIGTELNFPASECKIKWNLLRNSFGHALSRRKTVTGQGVKNFKKWKWEDEMSFLLPFMVHRNTFSNVDDVEHGQSSSAIVEETNENENVTQRKGKDKNNYYQEEILNLMKARSEKKEKHELDLFFQMVAQTVKNFPKSEQVKLKFEIMKMVHEVEIRCLDSVSESSGSSSRLSVTSTPSPPLFNGRTSSPYFRPQSASPQIAQQSSSHNTLQYSSPEYVPQSSPSPQIAQQSSTSNTLQYSSPEYVPQSSPSPQIAQQSSTSNTTVQDIKSIS